MKKNTKSNKTRKSVKKKILKVLLFIFIVIVIFNIIGTILHATYFKNKVEEIKPYGEMVNIYDGQMHVYSMGEGEKTIILLPGMGVSLPSAEFGPLMRTLSKKYKVVCIEYFGVGFSSETSRERSIDNYVEEIRKVLEVEQIEPPYVLVPHSISSVFSEYYASKYPSEIEAIISLDGTSTAYYQEIPKFVNSLLGVAKVQQNSGFSSIMGLLATNKKDLISKGYLEKEINDMIAFSGFSVNDNLLSQMANSANYIKETMDLPYPKTIPYFKVISKKTYETKNSQIKISPQEYQMEHLKRIGDNVKYEILEGNHFIYFNNVDKISNIIDDVIANNKK